MNQAEQNNGCPECGGSGTVDTLICKTCKGTGSQKVDYPQAYTGPIPVGSGTVCENRADKTPIGESKRANKLGDDTASAV